MADAGGALLESHELFGTEGLIVDLGGGFNEVLEMGACEEVAEVDEFAVVLVLDYNNSCQMIHNDGREAILPLMTPQRFWRPRTSLPLTTIVFSEPTTAKGRMPWSMIS